jgi:sugar lactone lactonase YvrE
MSRSWLQTARARTVRVSLALGIAIAAAGCATPVTLPDAVVLPAGSPFPESVTASAGGTLFVSSLTHGGVVKFAPGATTAVPFVRPGEHGTRSTLGVLADDRRGLLWVASNDVSAIGVKGPSAVEGAWIKGFDLTSRALKVSARLPGGPAIANDMAIGDDGSLYITNTAAPQILRLKPGTETIEVIVQDPLLKGGLDGIAIGRDGNLYVNTFMSGELFRIETRSGSSAKVTKLVTSRPLNQPDGLRPYKGGFIMVEGDGTVDWITIDGDSANVDTIAQAAEPTSVWLTADRMWIAEGLLSYLSPEKKGQMPDAFRVRAFPLPKN